MVGHSSKKQGVVVMVLASIAIFAAPRDADACGACFTSATESTVVSDHKMALKITNQQTILWDQITYTGNPKEFAYVVPARPGTKLESSNDAFFNALDLTTRPIIMAPQPKYGSGVGGDGYYRGGEGGGGCGCGSSDDMSASMSERGASGSMADAGAAGPPPVQIVNQQVVGPYETVTLRSTEPQALHEWLNQHGYAMPESAAPIIEQYVTAQFDFIALRLAPGEDVRSMKPIRIVSPVPDAELPLRMMQIGAGAKVGITLYVLAEGRYQPSNFPVVSVDKTKLVWDYTQNRSNYQELSQRAMSEGEGRGMLVEFANKANLTDTGTPYQPQYGGGMGSNPSLPDAYRAFCNAPTQPSKPKPKLDASANADDDAAVDSGTNGDASTSDGGDDDGGADDAGADDAGADDAGADAWSPPAEETPCDDLDSLLEGMSRDDLWITRIRSNLPNAALADTMHLEAAKQEPVDNVFQVNDAGTITARIARTRTGRAFGSAALIAGTMLFFSRIVRRRRHQSKS